MTHSIPKRNIVPKAVLMRSGLVSFTTARPVNTTQPKTTVNNARPMTNVFSKAHSTVRRPINNKIATKNSNFNQRVNTVSGKNVNTARPKAVVNTAKPKAVLNVVKGNQVNAVKASACWVWKPKTKVLDHGNPQMDLQDQGDQGVIDSRCSRHMTGNMSYLTDFEEIDGGYVAFGGNPKGGKITGRVPRKNNMYSVDLKNIVPKGGLTCLFAKATSDESKLWHRRLGHINFKTTNKLIKGNLLKGLPTKLFENDQTCVACQKGKQHRASCKSKTVSSISQPLHMLHMDLFGLTFVKSLMKKMYCLVVTDDYSRFSWVFFLATKDKTSGILKSFITGVENLIDQRVKVIRCENGTEFKNKEMNQFCERKGIKKEFSIARTPQQNGAVKRKNRTLIEADRTMLANSKLPTTFWAEAVNTASIKPALRFMRPFGYPVTFLNIDHLGKFDGKADEGFFVGYSINSKAFRVFNSRTMIVEENLHVQFSENTPNIAGSKDRMEIVPGKDCILLPLWLADLPLSQNSKSSPDAGFKPSGDNEKKVTKEPGKECEVNTVSSNTSIELPNDLNMPELEDIVYSDDYEDVGVEADMKNLNTFMPISPIPTTRIHKDHPFEQIIRDLNSAPQTRRMTKNLEEHEEPKKMDVKSAFFMVRIEEEVYVCQPPGFEDPYFPDKMISYLALQRSHYAQSFEKMMHKKFQMSSMGELTFFLGLQVKQKEDRFFISQEKYVTEILKKFGFTDVKTTSTPIETQKPLLKDENGKEEDVHLYRSMIGSLMYLTSSRPDIMFAVCACCKKQAVVANSTTKAKYVVASSCCGQVL
ncbi:putative ribonuclease H-like domain-containing protein [Tanacetum coccineum]